MVERRDGRGLNLGANSKRNTLIRTAANGVVGESRILLGASLANDLGRSHQRIDCEREKFDSTLRLQIGMAGFVLAPIDLRRVSFHWPAPIFIHGAALGRSKRGKSRRGPSN
ncbi:uncharacterized protein VTP21DRAFT_3796 [Calcarisporiella thermophila]|uniref:uncharacterized protein n=1 Tax=Calcarisporiella thermophila TaxID=911321 RepID=UPI0037446FA8